VYETVSSMIDIDNFITYQLTEIYMDNNDWPGNNMKWWRTRTPEGKFQWIVFDLDAGLGAWESYSHNAVENATDPDGDIQWPNPPWSTFLLRTLLENESFRNEFIGRFYDHLNISFNAERFTEYLEAKVELVEEEIRNQIHRWEEPWNMNEWNDDIETMQKFIEKRPHYVRLHLRSYFDLNTYVRDLSINIDGSGGVVKINDLNVYDYPWTGNYYKGNQLELTAIPSQAYQFAGWDEIDEKQSTITVVLDEDIELTAQFEPVDGYENIVINEINYNSKQGADPGDWIEILNIHEDAVDLSDWQLMDSSNSGSYIFPDNTMLASGELLVICRDKEEFSGYYPDISNILGDLPYGLNSKGETLKLFNSEGLLIDSVNYFNVLPWPHEPDGWGYSLALRSPERDNAYGQNWYASANYGTPGDTNDYNITIPSVQEDMELAAFFQVFPNPVKSEANISYYLPADDFINISVYSISGVIVKTLHNGFSPQGIYQMKWNTSQISPGMYICKIERTGSIEFTKIVVLK